MELSLPLIRREPRRTSRRGTSRDTAKRGTVEGRALARPLALTFHTNKLVLRILLCVLLALPVLGGGWLWLRGSSLVAVRQVHITGVRGIEGAQIRTALDDAAMRMTTLDFNAGALRSAVAQFPIVGGVRVRTSFPHTVRISVTERPPVAELISTGQHTAVAADGTVLGPTLLTGTLPKIDGSIEPSPGARLHEAGALSAVAVLGAAPPALARFVARVYNGPEGLTVAMRNGLLVYFGDATRPHAKWLSLARVLVSPSAAGALYVDVRLPERPAAGFSSSSSSSSASSPSTSTSTSTSQSTPQQSGSADPTTATLAASLEAAIGEGTPTGSATSSEPSSAGGTESEASSTGTPEASSSGGSETSAASSSESSGAAGSETSESTTG